MTENRKLWYALVALAIVNCTGCVYLGPQDSRFNSVSTNLISPYQSDIQAPHFPETNSELIGPQSVDDLISLALIDNPEIEEARLIVESLGHRPTQAQALPDPMLGSTTHLSQVQTAAGQQDFAISVNQKYVRQNKRDAKVQVAENEIDVARAKLAAIEQNVTERIKNAFFELEFVQRTISIMESDQKQLRLMEAIVDKRFRVLQNVTQQETLQIQVASSKLKSEIESYQQLKRSLQAKLARLVHTEPGTQIIAEHSDVATKLDVEFDQLVQLAIERKPDLHSQLFEIQKNRNATQLAELSHQSDYSVGLNWIMTSDNGISPVANGRDALMLTFGMNLPVYRDRIDANIRESQVKTLAQVKKYERLKDETAESVTDLFIKFNTTSQNLKLFKNDIIPKQKMTLDQSLKNYEVGETDYLQMIDNWRKLLQFQIMIQRYEADQKKIIASLERELGVQSIDELKSLDEL